MTNKRRCTHIIWQRLLAVASGLLVCFSGVSSASCGIPIVLGNANIEQHVASQFANNAIPYNWNSGVLCVDRNYEQAVVPIVSTVVGKYLKPGYSASLQEQINNAVKEALTESKIQFEEVVFQGARYLVWDPSDAEFVESIIRREKENFVRSLN